MSSRWSSEEDSVLISFYPSYGAMWGEWKHYLPGRSDAAIVARAHRLGLYLSEEAYAAGKAKAYAALGRRPWTKEEDALLREHFPVHGAGWDGWAVLIPRRSCKAIADRARKLCIGRQRAFTDAERVRILRTVVRLAESMDAEPFDVVQEVVRLGDEYERQAV